MTENIIAMPGSSTLDVPSLQSAAGEFGWDVAAVRDLREAILMQSTRKTVAVLFHRDAMGDYCSWAEAVARLKKALPDAHLIACHGMAESVDWTELSDAGAFQTLGLPLRETEIHQALGFVWEAERRLWSAAETLNTLAPARRPAVAHRQPPAKRPLSAGRSSRSNNPR